MKLSFQKSCPRLPSETFSPGKLGLSLALGIKNLEGHNIPQSVVMTNNQHHR